MLETMYYAMLECLVEYMDLEDILQCRGISKEFKLSMNMLCSQMTYFPSRWKCFMNVYAVMELFDNVRDTNNVGHRGNVLNTKLMCVINRLWLDYPISNFSYINLLFCENKLVTLTLNINESLSCLRAISRIHFPCLDLLQIICTGLTSSHPIFRYQWKVPKLRTIMFGTKYSSFPLCLDMMPLIQIRELCIVRSSSSTTNGFDWFQSFVHVWPHIKFSNIVILRLCDMVPLVSACMFSFAQALRNSHIAHLFMVPCTPKWAVFIMRNTSVYLQTEIADNKLRKWNLIQQLYHPRLQFA